MKRLIVILFLLTTIVSQAQTLPELRVVATTELLADWVRQVGGERVEVTAIVPVGEDPMTHVLSADDVDVVNNADVLFVWGTGLEPFLSDLLPMTEIPYFVVGEGVNVLGRPAPTLTPADVSIYMTVQNISSGALSLVTAEGDWFEGAMMHETMVMNDMAMMHEMDEIALPPDESLVFEPANLHLMLLGVRENLVADTDKSLTLRFSDGSELDVAVRVSANDITSGAGINEAQNNQVVVRDAWAYPINVALYPDGDEVRALGALGDDVLCQHSEPAAQCLPYVYLDGERAAQLVGNVALFIADLDPAHADEYTANSAAYQEEISVLDAVLVQECPDTTFAVTNPDDWAYAAERYDLTLTTDPSAEAWDVLLREAENYMKLMEEVREGCE